MCWGSIFRSPLEFTDLHAYYTSHLTDADPEKAKQYGFIPPDELQLADELAEDAEEDIPVWPGDDAQRTVLDLIYRTAVWLGLARGFPALQLFCDVVRHFNLEEPNEDTSLSRLYFLNRFVRMRVSPTGAIPKCIQHTPTPTRDTVFPDKDPDYFMDVAESHRKLAGEFDKKLTLVERKIRPKALANFNLQQPPRDRAEMHARRQTLPGPVVRHSNPIPVDPEKRSIQMASSSSTLHSGPS